MWVPWCADAPVTCAPADTARTFDTPFAKVLLDASTFVLVGCLSCNRVAAPGGTLARALDSGPLQDRLSKRVMLQPALEVPSQLAANRGQPSTRVT